MIKLKNILKEIEEDHKGHISKEEEMHAFQVMKDKLIPRYMDFIKDDLKISVNLKTTQDKLRKSLKKTKHEKNNSRFDSDVIEYSSPFFNCRLMMYKHYYHSKEVKGPIYGMILGFYDKNNARFDSPMKEL